MKRRISLILILTCFWGVPNSGILHAQMMAWGEYGGDNIKLNLVRAKGLREVDRIVEDSGRPSYKDIDQFHKSGDSIWEYSQYHSRFDSGVRNMLFDSSNRVVFESDTYDNSPIFHGRISYYFLYDSLGRAIKKTQLRTIDNRLITQLYSYSARGDSVRVQDYDEEGKLWETELQVYDRFGNQLFWSNRYVSMPAFPESEIVHNIYDSRGRLIERGSMPALNGSSKAPHPFSEKIIYVDSEGIENGLRYWWADTSWGRFPKEHSRMDSLAFHRISESFDTNGTLRATTVTDYKSFRLPTHMSLEMATNNFVRSTDYTYGPNDELISEVTRHNGHIVANITYTYIYSK
jgi:hypothetical protein